MSCSLDTPSFTRTPRLSRMQSRRIVHVVQTEENNNDVSVVTVSEDGHAEEAQETVDFGTLSDEDGEESALSKDVDNKPARHLLGESIFFEVDFGDGAVQQLTRCEGEDHQETTRSRKGSLFSDDEFEPIRMKLPKRTPLTLHLSDDGKDEQRRNDALPSPECPPLSSASDDSSHSGSDESPSLDHVPTLYSRGPAPHTAASSSTLFSVASTSSSTTYVNYADYPKSGGRTFCAFDEDGCDLAKLVDVVTPDSVTGTRGLMDLRLYGYNFDWSRFAGRSEVAHGLSPEDAAELEVFLSRGPNAFPNAGPPRPSVKKSSFEKKLRGVFKLVK